MTSIEDRIRRLEDLESIRALKIQYGREVDNAYAGTLVEGNISRLFTDDATWDGGTAGTMRGGDAIEGFFVANAARMTFSLHYVMGHTIEFQGEDHATGEVYMYCPSTIGGNAVVVAGTYNDEYHRMPTGWKISYSRAIIAFRTPFTIGWVDKPFIY